MTQENIACKKFSSFSRYRDMQIFLIQTYLIFSISREGMTNVVVFLIMYFCSYKDSINDDDYDFDEKEQESEDFTISWVKVHKLMGIRL